MEKKILLKFSSENDYTEGEADKVEFVTEGSLYEKSGKYYLKYTEMLGGDDKASKTTMKIENNKVTILRYGEVNTQMVLECGKKNMNYYETPCGSLLVGVTADTMSVNVGESRGEIKLNYDVEINNSLTSRNNVILTYEEIGGQL